MTQSLSVEIDGREIAGIRWTEIVVDNWPNGVGLRQDTLLVDKDAYRFFPTMTADDAGNAVMVLGESSGEQYPSTYYTYRKAADPLNTLEAPVEGRAGEAAYSRQSSGTGYSDVVRWGDYFDAVLDPRDGSFWIVGQYATGAGQWKSWIGNLAF